MESKVLLGDFRKAVLQLEETLKQPAESDLVRAGCIQYFEFCFELSWKVIKAKVLDEGLSDCNSPKSCLKTAFTLGWIDDESRWLDMLLSRNLMSHTYDIENSMDIYDKLSDYLVAFQALLSVLSKT